MRDYKLYEIARSGSTIDILEDGKPILTAGHTYEDEQGLKRLIEAANGNAEANTKTRKLLRDFGPKGDINL